MSFSKKLFKKPSFCSYIVKKFMSYEGLMSFFSVYFKELRRICRWYTIPSYLKIDFDSLKANKPFVKIGIIKNCYKIALVKLELPGALSPANPYYESFSFFSASIKDDSTGSRPLITKDLKFYLESLQIVIIKS